MTSSPIHPAIEPGDACRPVLVIGIGSPHGDDRAGWEVIDRLAGVISKDSSHVVLRKASVPHAILDWFELHLPTHLIDASCDKVPGVRQISVTHTEAGKLRLSVVRPIEQEGTEFSFDFLRSNSTHQIDLLSTLELGAALGRLPRQLCLWAVSIASAEKSGDLGREMQNRIDACVAAIATKLV